MAGQDRTDQMAYAPARGSRAWRALGWFWVMILFAAAGGIGTLRYLGPPDRPAVVAHVEAPAAPPVVAPPVAAAAPAAAPVQAAAPPPPQSVVAPPNPPGSRIAAPDPALLEAVPGQPETYLPRIAADGRLPMRVYAAGYDPADRRPRIAVLLAGIGMGEQDSEDAIHTLPAAISLAISPYAARPRRLLELARATGHELLAGIPMEPQGYPLNDAGPEALMTDLSPAENAARLRHALSLFTGYVGATGAMGNGLRGGRYAESGQIGDTLAEIARRGLLYIDPRPDSTPPALDPGLRLAARTVDVVLDEPPLRIEIDAKLAKLEQLARDQGSAIGLAGSPSPVTTAQLSAWAATLGQRGLALVPVSALVRRPAPPPKDTKR